MLVEARIPRRAAVAYCRNSGTLLTLARGLHISRAEAQKFLDGGHYHFVTPRTTERLLDLLDPKSRDYVLTHMRVFTHHSGKLPLNVISPVIEEALEDYGTTGALARATGINQRRLFAYRTQQTEHQIGFEVADRLICRSLGVDRWRQDDLRRWYWCSDTSRVLH